MLGKSTAAGATAAGASAGVGALAGSTRGAGATATVLGASACLAVSTFGSGAFSFAGPGFFSFTATTVSSLSLLPSIPSRAARKKIPTTSKVWKTTEIARLTFDELDFLRSDIALVANAK